MSEDSLSILRSAYDSFAKGDLDSVMDFLHPEVVWDASAAYAHRGAFFGPYEVHNYLTTLGDAWHQFRLEAEEFVPSVRGRYMVTGHIRGIERASGTALEAPFIHLLKLREGKISKVQIFVDRDRAVEALDAETTVA
jgi:ketosteroid isomerase-like protein